MQRGPQPVAEVRTFEARGPVIGGASAFVWRRFQAVKSSSGHLRTEDARAKLRR